MSEWERGRWWRVLAPDGTLWCETSDEQEARYAMRQGDTLWTEWRRNAIEWRPWTPDEVNGDET